MARLPARRQPLRLCRRARLDARRPRLSGPGVTAGVSGRDPGSPDHDAHRRRHDPSRRVRGRSSPQGGSRPCRRVRSPAPYLDAVSMGSTWPAHRHPTHRRRRHRNDAPRLRCASRKRYCSTKRRMTSRRRCTPPMSRARNSSPTPSGLSMLRTMPRTSRGRSLPGGMISTMTSSPCTGG